jgi:transcriptional antiterminator NusG
MAKNWYVVHTYSGYEHKAKAALEERARALGKQELFGAVLVPAEKVVELVKGRKKTSSRKFFPGYILVNMELNDETWHIVRSTPKVTGFVGGSTQPAPIPSARCARLPIRWPKERCAKAEGPLESGEHVKVIDGPFQDFNGVVEEVKPDKGKLRVLSASSVEQPGGARFRAGREGVTGDKGASGGEEGHREIKLQIPAGQANPSPPVGPALASAASTSWSFASSSTPRRRSPA